LSRRAARESAGFKEMQGPAGGVEGLYRTVRSPREMDPTNFRVETVRKAIIVDQTLQSENQELSLWEEELISRQRCWAVDSSAVSRDHPCRK
jgi:hypothetical protein